MNHAFISKLFRGSTTGLSRDPCEPCHRAATEHQWRMVMRRPGTITDCLGKHPAWFLRVECEHCGSRAWGLFTADLLWQMEIEALVPETTL